MDRLERGVFTPFTAERNRLVAAVAAIERRDASVELLRSAQATLLSRKTKLAVQRANRSAGSGSALDGVNAARAAEGMSLVRGAQQQQQRWCGRTAACAWGDATIVCVCVRRQADDQIARAKRQATSITGTLQSELTAAVAEHRRALASLLIELGRDEAQFAQGVRARM